jgi:hypothetical protein
MFKSFFVAALMFILVFTGMQMANGGIHKMKGYADPNFQNAISLDDNGEHLKATFLGNDISSHDINEKKKKLEEMSAFNFFSSMGKKIAQAVSAASEKIIHIITD